MAWNVNPSHEEIGLLMEAGIIYRDSRKFGEAHEVFNGVRALLPKSDVVEVALGTVSFQQGDFEAAARHYRSALELNPRSAYAYAHLGELAIFQKDKAQAVIHLKEAIKLDPRGVYGKLARTLLEFGNTVRYKEGGKS
jgi:tetratricopeptide (TPR) repeat protein